MMMGCGSYKSVQDIDNQKDIFENLDEEREGVEAAQDSLIVEKDGFSVENEVVSDSVARGNAIPVKEIIVADNVMIVVDDTISANDSIFVDDTISVADTIVSDSVTRVYPVRKEKPSAIDEKIERSCNDSTIQDLRHGKIYYYGGAQVKYDDIIIDADCIVFNFEEHTVYAKGLADSTGRVKGTPVFQQGKNKYLADEMMFNFDTKKGIITKVFTEESQGYIHGSKIKKMDDGSINIKNGSFTTCSNPTHQHYEFQFAKARVIPDDKIVTKWAYLKLAETPLPLAVPFALIPNAKGQRSGVLLPSFGESANRGFYFENMGYYWGINEYMDLEILGDIYTRGSWAIKPKLRYNKRYSFNGSFSGSYAVNKIGTKGSADYSKSTDFKVRWVHKQDPKARPRSSFSADVYIVSSNYNKYNAISTSEQLSNTFQSSVAYQTSFADNLFNLTVNGSHSQNTKTHIMTVTLPEVTLTMNRINPFKKLGKPGKKHWYHNINLGYTLNGKNTISMPDSLIFKPGWTNDLNNGIQHRVPVNIPVKLLKHISWTTSANFTDRMYFRYINRQWEVDTLLPTGGRVVTDTVQGFRNSFAFDVSSNFSTKIYGMLRFRKGPVRAVRHVFTPTIGFSYNPDFSTEFWNDYGRYIDGNGVEQLYSHYEGNIYGTPPSTKSGRLTYNLNNNLEIKVPSRKDSVTGMKKITLIESFTLSGSYDLAKDSLNWSYLSMSGRTTLFKNFSIQYSSSWDPYALDESGKKNINKFEWDANKRLFRKKSVNWNFSASYTFNNDTFKKEKGKPRQMATDNASEQEMYDIVSNPGGYVDWTTKWSLTLNYSLNITNTPTYINYLTEDFRTTVQTLGVRGEINLSPKWKFSAQTGYDFEQKKLSYTSLTIYRDLHCWEMRFNVIPYGTYKSWNFQINVKASALQDLKLTKKKDYRDNY